MNQAEFRFLGDLNHFLARARKNASIPCTFGADQSVKHLVEALGVPHTEVGEILANGQPVGFGYLPRDGERIEVHPVSIPETDTEPRFVLDNHLGRLTAHLRMSGFDCLYRNDIHDAELVRLSLDEGRILLTRDRRLLMHKVITQGYCLRSLNSEQQLLEVARRYGLTRWIKPFHRCLRCNHPLQPVSKEAVLNRLEPLTKLYFTEFHICPACDQVYWKGSHYERMRELIERVQQGQAGEN